MEKIKKKTSMKEGYAKEFAQSPKDDEQDKNATHGP